MVPKPDAKVGGNLEKDAAGNPEHQLKGGHKCLELMLVYLRST